MTPARLAQVEDSITAGIPLAPATALALTTEIRRLWAERATWPRRRSAARLARTASHGGKVQPIRWGYVEKGT